MAFDLIIDENCPSNIISKELLFSISISLSEKMIYNYSKESKAAGAALPCNYDIS